MKAISRTVREEVERIARHALTPVAVWLFSENFGDTSALAGADAAAILVSYLGVLLWSKYSEYRKARKLQATTENQGVSS